MYTWSECIKYSEYCGLVLELYTFIIYQLIIKTFEYMIRIISFMNEIITHMIGIYIKLSKYKK